MANENVGHRSRVRERMLKEGLSAFKDHEVLEMLLYQTIPRKDTNKIAHRLLDTFGSLSAVLDAEVDQLLLVEGVSHVTACNLALLKEVWQRYKTSTAARLPLNGMGSIVSYAKALVEESYVEKLVVVYVDGATHYLFREVTQSKSALHVDVDIRRIVTTSMRTGAAGVILFHCHVNGKCMPSPEDIRCTERLMFALAAVNVALLEHIIFNNGEDFYSFFLQGDIATMQEKYKTIK